MPTITYQLRDVVAPETPIASFRLHPDATGQQAGWLAIFNFAGERFALIKGPVEPAAGDLDEVLILLGWRRVSPWELDDEGRPFCRELIRHQPTNPELAAHAYELAQRAT